MANTEITLQHEGTNTSFGYHVGLTLPLLELEDMIPGARVVTYTIDGRNFNLTKVDGEFLEPPAGWSTDITYNVRCAAPTQVGNTARGPTSQKQKATRPMLPVASNGLGISERKWFGFTLLWETYKIATGLLESETTAELIYCLEAETFSTLIIVLPTATGSTKALLLSTLKDIAVQKTNKTVLQHEFNKLTQDHTESAQSFISTLKSKARECGFNHECEHCGGDADFSEAMISGRLIVGLSKPEIRRKILSRYDPDQKKLSLDKLILLVTGEESALNSAQAIDPTGTKINSVSSYKKDKKYTKNKDSEKKKDDVKCILLL